MYCIVADENPLVTLQRVVVCMCYVFHFLAVLLTCVKVYMREG